MLILFLKLLKMKQKRSKVNKFDSKLFLEVLKKEKFKKKVVNTFLMKMNVEN